MKEKAHALTVLASLVLAGPLLPPAAAEEQPTGAVPRVLIIGDSISLGYTPHVAKTLKGKAIVKHNRGNAQHTATGLKRLDAWIGKQKWDVIHFNWGLWDLCYRHPESKVQGRRDKVNGTVTIPLKQYEKNLDQLVTRLKRTDAALIWASTTVVPENEAGRFVEDAVKYNEAAARVMKKHDVAINDLHALTGGFPPSLFVAPGNVHFTKEGSKRIADQVVAKMKAAMTGEKEQAAGADAKDRAAER